MRYFKRFIKTAFILMLILTISLVGYGYTKYQQIIKTYPIEATIHTLQNREDYTPLNQISPIFLDAIVAIEDHRFYDHGAIDIISLARATITNFISGSIEQGGSTITQQLAKNLFLDYNQTLERKITEMFIAYNLEQQYSKDEILELYVNAIYYGDNHTGIAAASKGYFNKTPATLNFNEATLLAGLPQSPSYYALSHNYTAALNRQEQVVNALISFSSDYNAFALNYAP